MSLSVFDETYQLYPCNSSNIPQFKRNPKMPFGPESSKQPFLVSGIKTGSGRVCGHNARGRVRNRKSNPEGVSPRDLTYCSHKPESIVTTNPDRSVLIPIITWHFQFRPVNVSILHLKYDCRARSESRFACYSHCNVTWYPFATGIVASQCPSARDAVLVTRYLTPFISVCLNSVLRFLPQ